ncbi:MAG: transglutaminaseTgpA domain-containing protein [Candidatus Gorgyraea atricola]|nr:transglutaminaseTgpA domain-containing protein [Candidatus Gorgyraea atricola]
MDRDALYFHFSNLGIVLIGLFSIQGIINPFVAALLIPGTIAGFLVSWRIRKSRPQHIDTFIGMLSLAAVVVTLGGLFDKALTFDNLLTGFSIALAWLTLFQSFGLKEEKSYAMLQFIAVCLLISSISLALEQEPVYMVMLAVFLFIFIFAMRLSLVCEKKNKGSLIVGDQEKIMSLWQQIKVAAMMFSFVLIVASLVYPFVPRFENLSLKGLPSTLLGIPEKIPLLKLLHQAPKELKDNKKRKKEQLVDAIKKKRETQGVRIRQEELIQETEGKAKKAIEQRFRAEGFNKEIDIFEIKALTIYSNADKVPLGKQVRLEAELTMSDDSTLTVTKLVDWVTSGSTEVSINNQGNLKPKEEGSVHVSASYLGTFSNDLYIEILPPLIPIKKKGPLYYSSISVLWLVVLGLLFFTVYMFMRSKRLQELAIKDPKEFIKEIYGILCRGFKIYGASKFDYIAAREFLESVGAILSDNPKPMHDITEGFLEARFSAHNISKEHSQQNLGFFHGVKDVVLGRDQGKHFWKNIAFKALLLDVLLIPKT